MERYRSLIEDGYSELEVKRSIFTGRAFPVQTEQEAEKQLAVVRAAQPDANHHAFAYRLGGLQVNSQRFDDDGEPGGTAGRPVLEAIARKELGNILVVVSRLFGGQKLGAGGLIRAYGTAASRAIQAAGPVWFCLHLRVIIELDYNALGKAEHLVSSHQGRVVDRTFAAKAALELVISQDRWPTLELELKDLLAGDLQLQQAREEFYPLVDGETVIWTGRP